MRLSSPFVVCLLIAALALPHGVWAAKGPGDRSGSDRPSRSEQERIDFREACDNATRQTDMEINNVRARLTTGGDVWWDGDNGRYIVPKPPPGVPEVSSIFAGAVWLGGRDPGGGLKVAAQDYGRSSGQFDYYPGPLTPQGTIQRDTCERWDRFFTVKGESIRQLRAAYQTALENDALPLDPDNVPKDILGWPSVGNPYFAEINGFELPNPNEGGGLAGFWDEDLDGLYDPTLGDYPIIEIRGCGETPQFPEEMTFWIYNDAGNTHRQSNTPLQIQMEVQVQAFAYTTSDDINNMTFQRYKLINRAQEDILDTYFAMWVDPDLGCATDDYIGSDTTRSLAYVYNEDELDGAQGCTCDGGVETYCDEIPILGVDYFRGPRAPIYDINGNQIGERELGMSSFVYYNNAGVGGPPPATTDPSTAEEYYNYLQGRWRDGALLQSAGDGYDEGGAPATRYAFPDPPNVRGWNMTTEDLPFGDRRTIQASGPFTLQPGAVNELIIGVVWVPDQTYPAPSIQRLQQADDLAQSLFDNCFDLLDGPDAPDVDLLELDREVVMLFSNSPVSNNFMEGYQEEGLGIPAGADSLYRFEGYRVFQFSGPDVTLADIGDPNRVREIATYDLDNGVTRLFNWTGISAEEEDRNPLNQTYFVPELRVAGEDEGIRHSISITQDAFASGNDTRLINHRRYYFTVVAYAYNNYEEYDPFDPDSPGQPTQYIASSRNIGDPLTGNAFYTAIPRPILDRDLKADYGDNARVTRLSGQGNNGNFLDLTEETVAEIEAAIAAGQPFTGELTYERGAGPIDVFVANPLDIQDGEYEITFVDDNLNDDRLTAPVRWTLRCLNDCGVPTVVSERPIDSNNEQIVGEFGFSVRIGDVPEPGTTGTGRNGALGGSLVYDSTEAEPWLLFVPDNLSLGFNNVEFDQALFDYVGTDDFQDRYYDLDQDRGLTDMFPGIVPYRLLDHQENDGGIPFLSPVYLSEFRLNDGVVRGQSLQDLNNVNIVLTSDKSLWSRCPVIETSSYFYKDAAYRGQRIKTDSDRRMFDTRDAPSVSREAGPDGLPAIDRGIDPQFATGMGWFPGYAIDVETGQRLEIFWGENSTYDGRRLGDAFVAASNGDDMIFNPSNTLFEKSPINGLSIYDFPAGGQHYFYVTDQPYDGGVRLYNRLFPRNSPNSTAKVRALQDITWAGFPLLAGGVNLKSYADGIIPEDVTIKLRVNSAFAYAEGVPEANGYPTYRFTIDGKQANRELDEALTNRALDMINVVPNPYYGFSIYEDSQFETNVKITNLPARATVTIYSLDGKFIRQYNRDESEAQLGGNDRPVGVRQISPALEWDLRNQKGIPVASGVYLIHVDAPGLGERTLKFFGVQRQFDPSGL
ncbi:hypothetical protein GGR26_000558 [Lewinella marina]|uniref:T9SS C-terminal target domain-containing protein n=1 Tax=Neolewinella marina TaxID=438751 RepID=A0A2G0CJ79_9BACT|nr:hypothetical protein [Neolewinella marina]NJB84813.1 hypothetical protein [Neolewinella marina]PHL00029.1 hypothetical protein CGL56_03010 [Neolewinella marina]